jgi:hypothetical protein
VTRRTERGLLGTPLRDGASILQEFAAVMRTPIADTAASQRALRAMQRLRSLRPVARRIQHCASEGRSGPGSRGNQFYERDSHIRRSCI